MNTHLVTAASRTLKSPEIPCRLSHNLVQNNRFIDKRIEGIDHGRIPSAPLSPRPRGSFLIALVVDRLENRLVIAKQSVYFSKLNLDGTKSN